MSIINNKKGGLILKMNWRKQLIRFFALFCVVGTVHGAFTIEPAVITFDVTTREKTALLEVVNIGDDPIAVELTMFERVLDLDGELDSKVQVICKDFQIYPSEIILRSKERANVQLRYIGKQSVTADKAYVLFSKEVFMPLGTDDKDIDINIIVPTIISYYTIVAFETGKEGRLTFVSSKELNDGNIEVIVENKSNGRVVAKNLAIQTPIGIIKNFTGTKNSIMPGQKRRFTFKYLRPLTAKEVKFIY